MQVLEAKILESRWVDACFVCGVGLQGLGQIIIKCQMQDNYPELLMWLLGYLQYAEHRRTVMGHRKDNRNALTSVRLCVFLLRSLLTICCQL